MKSLRAALVGFVLVSGCTGGISGLAVPGTGATDSGTTPVTASDASTVTDPGITGVPTSSLGIPCAVQMVFQTRCQSCHSAPPVNGAPMPLVTLADMRSPALSNKMVTVAQMASDRMNSATSPMPPRGATPATAAEIKTVTDWVTAGAPVGIICGAPTTGGGGGTGGAGPGSGSGGTTGGTTTGGGGATGTVTATGVPCDIQTLLQTRCLGCHSDPPANNAPMPLTTFEFLFLSLSLCLFLVTRRRKHSCPPKSWS